MWWMLCVVFAGEIEVEMQTPVMFKVDGEFVNDLNTVNRATGLSPGAHVVTAENLFGRTVATLSVDVPVAERVTVRYAKKALTVVSRRAIAPAPVLPEELTGDTKPSASQPVVVTEAVSYAFTGVKPPEQRVTLGATALPYVESLQAFVAVELPQGTPLELGFHDATTHLRTDPFTTSTPGHYICDLSKGWGKPLDIGSCTRSGDAFTKADLARWAR